MDWTSTWPNAVASANWIAGSWQGKVANLSLSVPMAVKQNSGSPLHEVAAGTYNTYFTQIAQTLIAHGFSHAYIRLGEEFNQGYYPWAAASSPALWIQGFQQAEAAMKAVPGANFRFVWNPALYMGQVYPDQAYPGDAYVDVMGVDAYNASWDANTVTSNVAKEPATWNAVFGDNWGLQQFLAFAKAHNKPYVFPEWATGERPTDGHGGGDDPTFMANMAPLVQAADMESYWDYNASDFTSRLVDGTHPLTASAFSKANTAAGSIITQYATAWSLSNPLAVTCTNCHAVAIQNGLFHWEVIVWASDAHPSATLSWGFKATNSNIYDPASATPLTPVKAPGAVSFATFVLTPNKPLIVAVAK